MRILHVIYDDTGNPWLGGGGALRTREIYARIAARGHRVLVVCGNYPGAKRRETLGGVRYRRVGSAASYAVSRLTFWAGAVRQVARGGYDLVVEDVSPYSPVGAALWKPRGASAVASIQNLAGAHATAKYGSLGWLPRLVERPLLSLYRDFVVVSPGIATALRSTLGVLALRMEVIPNGVDPVFFARLKTGGDRSPYILFLGRIDVYQKGLDTLVAAFDSIAGQLPGVKLVIAGGGTTAQQRELEGLRAKAANADRIDLIGAVARDVSAGLLTNALFLAMPSRYEAWPLTALEAAAAGIPVVGFDITGVKDAAPPFPEGNGLLVAAGDTAAFAGEMAEVATNRGLREAVGARGRDWAKRHSWDNAASRQLNYYEEIVARARQAGG